MVELLKTPAPLTSVRLETDPTVTVPLITSVTELTLAELNTLPIISVIVASRALA